MAPVMDGETPADDSLARTRTRRTKADKGGRLAALQKLRQAKAAGEFVKYEVTEEKSVYDEVDEREYSKIVQDRQEDDWIIDDDGSGYVEDGREIFDDEDQTDAPAAAKGSKGGKKKAQNPNIRAPGTKPKSIRSMFAAAAVKSKPKVEKDINLNDDDVLGDIMAELKQEPSRSFMPPAVKLKKKPLGAKANPFSTKVLTPRQPPISVPKPVAPKVTNSEPVIEVSNTPPAPPMRKLKPPRAAPMMRTALDNLGDGEDLSQQIDDFPSQEVAAPQRLSQNIEEDMESSAVDVSGIDFDDDFGDEGGAKATTNGMDTAELDGSFTASEPASTWQVTGEEDQTDLPSDVKVDSSQLPLTTNEEGDQVLRMFWLDAYEDHFKQPGVVYLFGKVWVESAKTHVSCCVCVKNIERKIYLLPRKTKFNMKTGNDTGKPVTFLDVYQEFNENVAERYKIMKYKSKKATKQYAFEIEDVPAESEYLEVQYSAEFPQLPSDLKGESFSHVFGSNTSSLELFLLERKLKGPSWIDIAMPQLPNPQVSWCKVEAFISRPDHVTVLHTQAPAPPLVVMTLNLRTLPNAKTHQNEVIAASCLVQHKFFMDKPAPKPLFQQHVVAVTKPSDSVFPFDFKDRVQQQSKSMKVEVMLTERALLGFLLAKIHKTDPDLIVGHDIFGFDLDVILHRIQQTKTPHWSRLGRLKRASMPRLSSMGGAKGGSAGSACSGRLVCDVKISARELIRCRSYDLTELVSQILKDKRSEVDVDQIRGIFNHSNHLLQLLEWTLVDARSILRLMYELNVIPLALQITNICGNIMPRTLMGGRAERNEYLLLHAFTEKNFIPPDKQFGKKQKTQPAPGPAEHAEDGEGDQGQQQNSKKSGRRKPAYAGGLVLEPKKGFYDKYILLLDFNSLYPSIIQEYNICFTTINARTTEHKQDEGGDEDLNVQLPDPDLEPGVLPTEIRKLVQSRRQVKQLMKGPDLSPEMYMQYDIRQKALKLTANSMYGCLGFTFSRFYAKPLAALITGKGREILMKTKDLVQNMNLEVIYGDTDSIMVNTNSTDIDVVFKLGNKVKTEVNKLYRLLEIDIDGVFKSMLLLKKKKYAALTVTKVGDKYVTSQELKGLDIVRRDWCELAKEAGNFVVTQILSGESRESIVENIHSKLIEVAQKVAEGSIPVELFQITRQLTKNPEDYPDKKSLPHVQVALRMNSKGGRQLRGGDTVYYVICEDGSKLSHSQRAYHPDELAKREDLKIDTKYYLESQVHPVVSRLCDPIDGTDAAHIAECLGLDPTGYRHAMMQQDNAEENALLAGGQTSDEERYKDCDRLKVSCPDCGKEIIMDGVFVGASEFMECSLSKCPNAECTNAPYNYIPRLQNQLTLAIRAHIKKYYEGWLQCEDSACSARVKKLPLTFNRGHPVCHMCHKGILHPEYTDSALYTQLSFYQYMFDLEKALSLLSEKEHRNINIKTAKETYGVYYQKLRSHVGKQIRQSAYSEVNLNRLFDGLFTLR